MIKQPKRQGKPNKNTKKGDVVEFLNTAKKRFARLHDNDQHNREAAKDNIRFAYDIDQGQWSEADRQQREQEGRPCLTSDKLRKFVASVANSERDQRAAGNVVPVDSTGDEIVAEVISGIIRHIEHMSDAQRAYTLAGEQAIAGNEGFWRIVAEELPDSFDQELFIREIRNQFSVYLDPDGMFGFIGERLTREEFEYQYPDANPEDADTDMNDYDQWYQDNDVFIREYFYKERVKTTIVQASRQDPSGQLPPVDGQIFELPRDISEEEFIAHGWTIDRREDGSEIKKTPHVFKVKWAKITASQILEEGEWAGKDIPIIPVEGDWVWLEGKLYKKSLIEYAKDDQRMYNFFKSAITERYALAAKAPYLVTAKMIDGFKSMWDVAHKKMLPFLTFKHDKNMPGGPRREIAPQISTGETSMLEITERNIEDTTGRFKSSFGQSSNERSKVAIDARANRSDQSTFHFPDNFHRALNTSTRQLIDLIPKIYDTQRIQRILGEDGEQMSVILNQELVDEQTGESYKVNDLNVGKYDLNVKVKLMSTRREEQLAGMRSLVEGNPQLGILLAGDMAKLQDWDGHRDIAQKIEAILPQLLGLKPEGEGQGEPQA